MRKEYLIEKEIYNKEKVKGGTKKWGFFWDSNLLNKISEQYNKKRDEWANIYLKDKKILILGAARNNIDFCIKYTNDITAIDISERQIENIKAKYSHVQAMIGDITTYNYPEGYYDAVFCSAILHHVPKDLDELFDHLHYTLKDEGNIFVYCEPLRLNPLLVLGRRFFPSQNHTPGEQPFLMRDFKKHYQKKYELIALQYCFFLTLFLGVFVKVTKINRIKFLTNTLYKINSFFYKIDCLLAKTPVNNFFWLFAMVLKKK